MMAKGFKRALASVLVFLGLVAGVSVNRPTTAVPYMGINVTSNRVFAATNCPISAGASSSTISSTVSGCASGSTVTFAAGTYSLSSTVSVPCGVSLSGPTVPLATYSDTLGYKHLGYAPTAILNWTGGSPGVMFNRGSCSTAASVNYIECNMNHPSGDGGQCVYNGSVTSNFSEFGNYFHGNQGTTSGGGVQDSLDYFDGNSSDAADTNISITWNRFGATGDCSNVMNVHTDEGGNCNSIGFHTSATQLTINNNFFDYNENELKFYEGTGNGMARCLNCTVAYNDFSRFHRIAFETQANFASSSSSPSVSMIVRYNSLHDPFNPSGITFGLSVANGCDNTNPSPAGCVTNTDDNVIIDNVPAATGNLADGIEQWGSTGSTANYNLIQGEWANSIIINKDGAFSDYNNLIQNSYGAAGANTPADCYPGWRTSGSIYGWWGWSNAPVNTPSPTSAGGTNANTCQFFDGSVQTSASPTISPASGFVASGTVVTIATTGTNRDANTSNWCTTDTTTPVPGAGSAKIMTSYTVTSNTTLKCVGMWGAANQPTTYAVGGNNGGCTGSCTYGYQSSSVQTANYTTSGAPTAATPVLSPATSSFTTSVAVSITDSTTGAAIYYTLDGTTPTTSSMAYSGAITLTSTTTINAIAVASGYNSSATGTGTYTRTSTAPTITGGYQGNVGSINTQTVGAAAIQQFAYGQYSDSSTHQLPDAYGNSAIWSSSNTAILSVSSAGLVSCVAAGTANSVVTLSPAQTGHINGWTWTCTAAATPAATPTFSPAAGTITGTTSITISSSTSGATIYYNTDGSTPPPAARCTRPLC